MSKKRTPWAQVEVDDFVRWHNERLRELKYPADVADRLARDRDRWLATVKRS